MITHTITIPELLWSLFSIVGFIVNGLQFRETIIDYLVLRRKRINSIREYAAISTMIMYGTWTLTQSIFVLIGLLAMSVPSSNNIVSPIQYAIVVGFVSISAMLAMLGIIVNSRRRKLLRIIEQFEDMGGGNKD